LLWAENIRYLSSYDGDCVVKAGDRICHAASNPLIHEIVYARGDV